MRQTVFAVLTLFCLQSVRAQPPDFKHNVLVIVTDDAGYADFGCFGGKEIPTPNIDRLAKEGVRFTQAYVSASVCCPSRAGLLTGRYQQRFGHEFNGPSKPINGYTAADMGLSPAERTLGEVFQAEGYRTFAVGKWHMGLQPQFHPRNQGFDEFYGFLGGSRSYFPVTERKVPAPWQMHINDFPVPESSLTYLTDDLADKTTEFIRETFPYPWLTYLAFNAVHTPMNAKADDLQQFAHMENPKRRTYAAMTKALDDAVGQILTALDTEGVTNNTLVILINDNGGATSNGSDNGMYRGRKGSKWEGGLRVPMLMRWPGKLPAGTTYDQPVSAMDILPTALAAIGARKSSYPANLDGVNLLPYLTKEKQGRPHETLFWRRGVAAAFRKGDWKLIRVAGKPVALVNLNTDPSEKTNLLAEEPSRVKQMLEELSAWEQELSPPKWREGAKWEKNQRGKHQWEIRTREDELQFP